MPTTHPTQVLVRVGPGTEGLQEVLLGHGGKRLSPDALIGVPLEAPKLPMTPAYPRASVLREFFSRGTSLFQSPDLSS
jgi:hypothetical protein